MLLSTAVLLALLFAAPPLGAAPPDAEAARLPGLIVDEDAAPRDARGRVLDTAVRGARAWRPLAGAVAQRRAALAEQRRAAGRHAAGAAFAPIAPLPGDAAAPARMDSGDPDPDRLRSTPPPPVVP